MKELFRYKIYDKKGGPVLYFHIDWAPHTLFYFHWDEWAKTIKIFGLKFHLMKLPF
jgi:hypothetical protein